MLLDSINTDESHHSNTRTSPVVGSSLPACKNWKMANAPPLYPPPSRTVCMHVSAWPCSTLSRSPPPPSHLSLSPSLSFSLDLLPPCFTHAPVIAKSIALIKCRFRFSPSKPFHRKTVTSTRRLSYLKTRLKRLWPSRVPLEPPLAVLLMDVFRMRSDRVSTSVLDSAEEAGAEPTSR
jgi:hypothetical protein